MDTKLNDDIYLFNSHRNREYPEGVRINKNIDDMNVYIIVTETGLQASSPYIILINKSLYYYKKDLLKLINEFNKNINKLRLKSYYTMQSEIQFNFIKYGIVYLLFQYREDIKTILNTVTDIKDIKIENIFEDIKINKYQYEDVATENTIYYYRLKQIDESNASRYIPIIASSDNTCYDKENSFTAYPNPTNNSLFLKLVSESVVQVDLIDDRGQVVYSSTEKPNDQKTIAIETSQFATGLYAIKVNSNNNTIIKKILINR